MCTGYTKSSYDCIGISFIQNDALYYLIATDGVIPIISLGIPTTDSGVWLAQIMAMNKSSLATTANRVITVRFALIKK